MSAAVDPAANEPEEPASLRGSDLGVILIALVTVAAVAAALADGAGGYAVVGPLGGVALVAGTAALGSRRFSRIAIGSCGFVAGLLAAAAASVRAGSVVLTVATVATVAIGFALVPRPCRSAPVRRVVVDSFGLLVLGGVLVAGLAVGWVVFVDAFRVLSDARTAFDALLTLQLLVIAAVPLTAAAAATVDRWSTGDGDEPGVAFLNGLEGVPSGVYTAVGIQVFVWLVFRPGPLVESALTSLGPVGVLVSSTATSGYLHGIFLATCFGAAIVVAADWARPVLAGWLEPIPLRTLAFATGGMLVALLAAGRIVATGTVGDESTGVTSLIVLGIAIPIAANMFPSVGDGPPLAERWRSAALGVGVAGLFVATLVAAVRDLHPVGVFVGVALALFAWDVGSNVLTVRRQVGPRIDTREPELVRAAASLIAGGVGVAIAAAAMYVVGGASPPSQRWQAIAPIAVALAAIVVAVAALERWPASLSIRERVSGGGRRILKWLRSNPITVVVALALGAIFAASPAGATVLVIFIGVPVGILAIIHRYSSVS